MDFYVLTSKESFDSEVYDGCYSGLLVRGTGFDEYTPFSNEYDKSVAELAEKVEELGLARGADRSDSLYHDAMKEITDAKKRISDAETRLANGKAEMEDAKRKIRLIFVPLTVRMPLMLRSSVISCIVAPFAYFLNASRTAGAAMGSIWKN